MNKHNLSFITVCNEVKMDNSDESKLVKVKKLDEDNLISRSEAKRLLSRLEPFQSITLDFAKVNSVGQGFVDEVFRVYLIKNPHVKIHYINANEEVTFMIKRGLA